VIVIYVQLVVLLVLGEVDPSKQSALVVGGNFVTPSNLQNLVSFWNGTWYEIEFLSQVSWNNNNYYLSARALSLT
jgi:hypothetical protein